MTLEEKASMYSALGVVTYLENAIEDYKKQYNKLPHKIILGDLEWKLMGLDFQDDYYVKDVLLSCNSNVESGTVLVEAT